MSILSRIPNLIPSKPSSAPQEAMIASQKAHIDELVQRTRVLDNTVKSLQEQLSNSRAEWQAERKEWADGCDSLMACHRIAHLQTNVVLAQERIALAHERDLTRRERVAVIQRDYNLILFKAREKELELEADQSRDELRGAADGNVALIVELREKLAEGMQELKDKAALLRDAEKARENAEELTTHIRTEHVALQAQLSSARTNLERLTLRLEDAQTALSEKEQLNNELQQEKAALKVQVGKWKSLDDRGGAEVEELHKQRAALEGQIKRLESRLTEEQNKVLAHEKAIQKEHRKVEKLQQALEEQARIAEEAKAAAEHIDSGDGEKLQQLTIALEEQTDKTAKAEEEATLLEEQCQHYKDQLDKALRRIEKLGANSQSSGARSRSRVQPDDGPDQVEVKNPAHSEVSPSPVEIEAPTKARPSGKKPAAVREPDENGKTVAKQPDKRKGRQASRPAAADNKRKRKAPPDDDGTDTIESTSDKAKPTKSKAQKNQTTAKELDVGVDADDAAMPKKKKMRRLNLFASAKPDSLDWANQFNLGGGGLDIPTELSPVKVPARSLAGKSASISFRKS